MDNSQLQHWGIKGMRWGVRRYQNKDGSLTPKGRKRYAQLEDEMNKLKPKSSDDGQESYEMSKSRAVKSGSATELLRYKGDLTQQEMQSAAARIRWEQEMKQISDKETAPGKSKVDKAFETIGKVTDYAEKGFKLWNTFANVYNAFGKSAVQLPKIDTNIVNGNRQQRKEEKKKQAEEQAKKQKEQQEKAAKETKQPDEKKQKESSNKDNVEKVKAKVVKDKQSKVWDADYKDAKRSEPIDAEFRDIPISDADSSPYTARGQAVIAGLLEAPKELTVKRRWYE